MQLNHKQQQNILRDNFRKQHNKQHILHSFNYVSLIICIISGLAHRACACACVCLFVYTYFCVYEFVCVFVCVHIFLCVCVSPCVFMCTYICVYVCFCVCACICVYVFLCVCARTCTYEHLEACQHWWSTCTWRYNNITLFEAFTANYEQRNSSGKWYFQKIDVNVWELMVEL